MGTKEAKKQSSQPEYDMDDDDSLYSTRSPSSARKYQQPVQRDTLDDPLLRKDTFVQKRRASVASPMTSSHQAVQHPEQTKGSASHSLPPIQLGQKRFPLLAVLVGMMVMALLVVGLTSFSSWWRTYQDDLHYGRPRTFQLDAVVGHSDSASSPTHFIFINLHRHVEIIEFPGGDASHARVYSGPVLFGDGQDLIPVTGEVRDVNGDGKPDLIVHIQDQTIIYINDGTQFRPLQPGEQVHI